MLPPVIVHPRIKSRHPELDDDDIITAWNNTLESTSRIGKPNNETLAIGFDGKGRLIEMVAERNSKGMWLIFHSMTPPSKKTIAELRVMWG